MSDKGINQLDFAVSIAILITVFAFTVWQLSDYYSGHIQSKDSLQLESRAFNLWEVAFGQEGIPPDWDHSDEVTRPSLGSRIWKVPVYLEEYNDTTGNYTIEVPVSAGETHGRPGAWKDSVIAFEDGNALPTDIKNNDGNGFIEEFEVLFETEMEGGENKTVEIYYSQDNTTSVEHEDLTYSENATVNATVFSPTDEKSVSGNKANSMEEWTVEQVRESYGIEHGFRVYFSSENKDFSKGMEIPEDTDVEIYSATTLYQAKNGTIEKIKPKAVVW